MFILPNQAYPLLVNCQQPTSRVSLNNFDYATLDNVQAEKANVSSQIDPISLPSGWDLVPDDPPGIVAARNFTWGAQYSIFIKGLIP